jgi:Ca2+-binding EF-hand superfamily protein
MNSTQFKSANFPSYYNNGKKKKLTREELILLEQEKENNANVIGYKEFIKLLHDFQIRSREKYLKNFVTLFKRVDKDNNGILNEEEFISFVNSFGLYNENFEEHIGRLLSMIDPYRNNQITFSECVSLFSMEIIEDKKNGDLSLLDKICIGDIIEENIEQEG